MVSVEALKAWRDATETGVMFTRAGIKDLLRNLEENSVLQKIWTKKFMREIIGLSENSDGDLNTEEMNVDDGEEHSSVEEHLKCSEVSKVTLERRSSFNIACSQSLAAAKHELRLKMQAKHKQSSIPDYFGKK